MSVLSTTTKGKAGIAAAKQLGRHPGLLSAGLRTAKPATRLGLKASKPVLKRRARRRAERFGEAARTIGQTLAVYGPTAACELGLAEPPKPKRTAPRVAAGIVIGAGAMYFLEPEHGPEHREKVAQLVG